MKCVFCEFVKGKRTKNLNKYPFIIINETPNTMSFLSTDFPKGVKGHLLVIPKKHIARIEDIPKNTLHELISHVSLMSSVVRKMHQDCNILVNNGKHAGQHINHVHFHVIPRHKKDSIKFEIWKHKKILKSDFIKLTYRIKSLTKIDEIPLINILLVRIIGFFLLKAYLFGHFLLASHSHNQFFHFNTLLRRNKNLIYGLLHQIKNVY